MGPSMERDRTPKCLHKYVIFFQVIIYLCAIRLNQRSRFHPGSTAVPPSFYPSYLLITHKPVRNVNKAFKLS